MMTVAEVREWLREFSPDDQIGIDEGGLQLVVLDADAAPGNPGLEQSYLEVGGIPEEYFF